MIVNAFLLGLAIATQGPITASSAGALQVGFPTDCLPASKQFPGLPRLHVYPPARGRTWLTAYKGQAAQKGFGPGKYILASEDVMHDPDGLNSFSPQGEVVEIESWAPNDTGTWRAEFPDGQQLWANWRGKSAWLVKVPIASGVRIKNYSGTVAVSCADDVEIEAVRVPGGWTLPRAISIQFCRNVRILDVTVGAPAGTGPGQGYAVQVQRSTLVSVRQLKTDGARHSFTVFGGAEISLLGLVATNPKGTAFDTHGFGSLRVFGAYLDCGGADVSIGGKYPYGDSAEVWEVRNAKTLWVYGPSSIRAFDSVFGGPLAFDRNQYGEPVAAYAERCTFTKYSSTESVHYQGSGPYAVVPDLVDCVLK